MNNTNTLLTKVKSNLGITGSYQDTTIQGWIDEVKGFLVDGGVAEENITDGIVTIGVKDLWNYGSGDGSLSPYFFQRATQLALKSPVKTTITIKRIKNYFYEMICDNIDYDYAYQYMKEKKPFVVGGCSSVRNGNWYGRNLDWTYDENAEFLVRTPNTNGRYASIGVASAIPGLTNDFVKTKEDSKLYKIVPFMLADGINEKGLVVNTNVVPLDKGITSRTIPAVSEEVEICSLMLVRYVLDHFTTAKAAAEYIRDHMAVYMPTTLLQMKYQTHYMIADENKTYLVEFVGNETVISEMDKPYMTNFYLVDVAFNQDGKVYTPADVADEHLPSENNITDYGSGLERYNLIVDNYDSANSKDGMRELMDKLKYTNAYKSSTDPFWYTEFVGANNLTVNDDVEDYIPVVTAAIEMFENRTRDSKTWQTTHSVIYDIAERKAYIIVQEDGTELEFTLGEETDEVFKLKKRVDSLEKLHSDHTFLVVE